MPGAPLSITVRIQRLERTHDDLVQQLETTPIADRTVVAQTLDVVVHSLGILRERRDRGLSEATVVATRHYFTKRIPPAPPAPSHAEVAQDKSTGAVTRRMDAHRRQAQGNEPARRSRPAVAVETVPSAPIRSPRQRVDGEFLVCWPLADDPKAPPTVLNERGGRRR